MSESKFYLLFSNEVPTDEDINLSMKFYPRKDKDIEIEWLGFNIDIIKDDALNSLEKVQFALSIFLNI